MIRIIRRLILPCTLLGLLGCIPVRADERTSWFWDIRVERGQTADDDVICFFCAVHVQGTAEGDVIAFWAGVDVDGEVKGDVVVIGGAIRVRPGGRVQQDAVAIGGPVRRDEGGTIGEDTVSKPYCHMPGQRQLFWRGALVWLVFLFATVLLALLVLGAKRVYNQAEHLTSRPLGNLFTGLVAFAVILGLYKLTGRLPKYEEAWALGVTVVWTILFLFGLAGACAWLGRAMMSTMNMLSLVFSGALLIGILTLIPLAGLVIFSLVMFWAMGLTLLTRFGTVAPHPPSL